MRKSERDIRLATTSAMRLFYSLLDMGIPENDIFNFLDNSDTYKGLLDNDYMLILLLKDDSMLDIVNTIARQIKNNSRNLK